MVADKRMLVWQEVLSGVVLFLLGFSLFALILPPTAHALPSGASVTYISNTTVGIGSPGARTDPRSTITTVVLNASQQDAFWKAYVGNVTGVLTLDDANGYTIYDWSLTGVTLTGEIYASRSNGLSFTNGIQCANSTVIAAEEAFNNMTSSQVDSINSTFSYRNHTSFLVGPTTISANTCPSTATYVNDAPQVVNENAKFQETLLQDDAGNLIYVTLIEDNSVGFDGSTYDFQMLVGESDRKQTPTTYYFYTEIGS